MKRWTGRIALIVLVVIVAGIGTAYWAAVSSLPRISGQLALPGLTAPVDVVRDHEGVPHIYAQDEGDAYFALGFVHAQDRLWQMEMNRRIAAGTMAEILGKDAVNVDLFLRTLGVRRSAQRQVDHLDAQTRRVLRRYADGVNAFLAQRRGALPVEFLLTGAPSPQPWTEADSLGWLIMMSWDLSGNWEQELLRMRLASRLSQRQIDEFLPPYPGNHGVPDQPLKTADYTVLYRSLRETQAIASALHTIAPPGLQPGIGSNNWVVDGAHSETGKPLLANDPHLSLSAPSLWYFAHLSAPGLETIGATLPGLPLVVLGRTARIAWGFTNTGPDTQDLYIEEIRGDSVRTPDGWQPLETRRETIRVKGEADRTLVVRESRHGPLVSDVLAPAGKALAGVDAQRYAIAFQWTALRADDTTLQAGVKLDHARDWAGFLAAARDFTSPEQNIVYADTDGNIGEVSPGRVPIRAADNDFLGLAPAPGWDARYDWVGFVPFDQLPQQFNPASGRIVTANQKIVPDDYRPFITSEWEPPYRAERITALIDAQPRHSMQSFAAIQADRRSEAAVEMLPLLLATTPSGDGARDALERLRGWDGTMDSGRIEPTIYEAWMRELARLVYADELGPALFADYFSQRQVFLFNVLRDQDGQSRWCDDVSTPRVETCDEIKARALDLALADLERRLGKDRATWLWGRLHTARSAHRPFTAVPLLARWFDLRQPVGGDRYTVDVSENYIDAAAPFEATAGPSLRALYDLSNLENSRFIESTGESGNRFSPLYDNRAARWGRVEYLPMQTQRAAVEAGALGTLRLTPTARDRVESTSPQ
jgi:penicillin amidase